MSKRKVKAVQIAIAHAPAGNGTKDGRSHVAMVDTKGRVWERFSDMPIGEWGQVEAPDYAGSQSKRPVRKR